MDLDWTGSFQLNPFHGEDPGSTGSFDKMPTKDPGSVKIPDPVDPGSRIFLGSWHMSADDCLGVAARLHIPTPRLPLMPRDRQCRHHRYRHHRRHRPTPSPPPPPDTAARHRPPLPTASGSAPACPQSAGRLRLRRAGRGPVSSGRWTVRRSVTCSVISRPSPGYSVVISRSSCGHQWGERLVKVGLTGDTRGPPPPPPSPPPSRRCRHCRRVAVVAWSSLSTTVSGESEVVVACVIRRPSAPSDVSNDG